MRLPQYNLRDRLPALAAILVCCSAASSALADAPTGELLFRDGCARCHGAKGEGTDDNYPEPLEGDKSIAQLAKVIHETMPDDADEKASPEDAAMLADYIYNAFYSPEARVRNKPARIELSRLTVRQYQNAVADLIGSFRPTAKLGSEHGLPGEYYQSRYIGNKKKFDRTDPQVDFDFEDKSPDEKQLEPEEFSILWRGSIFAPDTGEYEFAIRTQHAARLYVNDNEVPAVDAWVKSGDDEVHRASLRLLGGRHYPIKIEFSKAKQGVGQDPNKKHKVPAKAFISLLWKRPNHAEEVVDSRYLFTKESPEVFVVQAHFPPDDRSVGYERGTAISKAWDEATTEAAIELTTYITEHFTELAHIELDKAKSDQKFREFCINLVEHAFRRPLDPPQRELYVDGQLAKAADPAAALKRVILLTLKSPRFLYREVSGRPADDFDVAARISFGLWDSLPDQTLNVAVSTGQLTTRDEISTQLNRMLSDVRTKSKLREFFLGWLKISQPRDLSKDPKAFPDFTPDVVSDLRTSLELSLDEMLDSGSADFREFLLSDDFYLNGRLAKIYGVNLPENSPFEKVAFESDRRAGVLSHPYLLASLAYTSTSSPIHRGVFLSRSVLGRVLRPPAQAVAPLSPEVHANLTTRERVALQTQPEACQGCHNMINPLGFTLEHFDAIGRYRDSDRDRPIDASGSYFTQDGEEKKFRGEKELAAFLADSEESQTAFVKQLFHHTVKQPIRAYGPDTLHGLQQSFAKNNFNIQKLLIEIVATSAMPPVQ
jgi:cytochrome c553